MRPRAPLVALVGALLLLQPIVHGCSSTSTSSAASSSSSSSSSRAASSREASDGGASGTLGSSRATASTGSRSSGGDTSGSATSTQNTSSTQERSTAATSSESHGASSTSQGVVDAGPVSCGCHGKAGCAVWQKVFITWYGFNDNSCTVESQHDCNTIAFPGLGPQMHQVATEGKGTYDDPITCAAAANNDGGDPESNGGATLSPGTIVYNPEVQKYFIMEDQCAECTSDHFCQGDDDTSPDTEAPAGCQTDEYLHIDFWMGPSFMQNANNLNNCEDNSTIGNPYAGTGVVIVHPPSDLPVVTSPLFVGSDAGNGGCWTSQQVNGDSCD